jgi:hypothetical protein
MCICGAEPKERKGKSELLEKRERESECLDWQNSQFINIVGKDDVSAAITVKRMEVA